MDGSTIEGAGEGAPAGEAQPDPAVAFEALMGRTAPVVGEAVLHVEHGLAILDGIETVEEAGGARDYLALRFAEGERLLVSVGEMARVWRYGPAAPGLALDALGGEGWAGRRAEVEAEIERDGALIAEAVRERRAAEPASVAPDEAAMAEVAKGFPHRLTPDQEEATRTILADLSAGRLSDRLVIGDVGYGKTEVALRAVAAVALAGGQAAVIAPTTILARQHAELFARRLKPLGIEVAEISRLIPAEEAKAARRALRRGEARVAIGTHALAAKAMRYEDLRLVVIDEEHRFGADQKDRLARLSAGCHVLRLSATPIPQTLAAALIGLIDVSPILTPPAARVPTVTRIAQDAPGMIARAVLAEAARGGQSFVIAPRIADLAPLKRLLAEEVPDLKVVVAHGRLKEAEVAGAVARFAAGEADILLSTSIVENGLDVPRANAMVITGADRFGLAELHQMRGRIGRGDVEGHLLALVPDPAKLGEEAEARLDALRGPAEPGAGLMVALRDAGARGAGRILGTDQTGHLERLGLGLHRHLLARAMRRAGGGDPLPAEVDLADAGRLPAEAIPDPDARLEHYARILRAERPAALERAIAGAEVAMGEAGEEAAAEARAFFRTARRRLACRRLKASALSVGPKGVALTFPEGPPAGIDGLAIEGERAVLTLGEGADPEAEADALLERLLAAA